MPENSSVWKSENQGLKEATFIQMDRRDRVAELGWKGHSVVQRGSGTLVEWQSHIQGWWIKTGRDNWGMSDPSPKLDCTGQGLEPGK